MNNLDKNTLYLIIGFISIIFLFTLYSNYQRIGCQTLAQYIDKYYSSKQEPVMKIELDSPIIIEMDIEKEVRINASVPSTVANVTKNGDFVAESLNLFT